MFENIHKSPVSFAHTQPGILDLFSRDVGIVIANRLIVFADLDADIVQMAVDAFRLDALAFDPSLLYRTFHSCSGTLISAPNCEIGPLIVLRPITG